MNINFNPFLLYAMLAIATSIVAIVAYFDTGLYKRKKKK
jgi:hypothetical protein